MPIHPTAIVDKSAELDATVEVGAFAVVEKNVHIAAHTRLWPHAYVSEGTTLGEGCQIHPFAVVGHLPQDLKFKGEPTFTEVGAGTVVREHASIHRGEMPGSRTIVGQRCFIMATGHIAHNCVVGDDVVIANSGLLAGHVHVGSRAFVSGHVGIHQFTRIGEFAMLAGRASVVLNDIPPFMLVEQPGPVGINVIGLRRAGFSPAERLELRECHRLLYRSGLHFPIAIERVIAKVQTEPGRRLAAFLQAPSKRGYMPLKRGRARSVDDQEAP